MLITIYSTRKNRVENKVDEEYLRKEKKSQNRRTIEKEKIGAGHPVSRYEYMGVVKVNCNTTTTVVSTERIGVTLSRHTVLLYRQPSQFYQIILLYRQPSQFYQIIVL